MLALLASGTARSVTQGAPCEAVASAARWAGRRRAFLPFSSPFLGSGITVRAICTELTNARGCC